VNSCCYSKILLQPLGLLYIVDKFHYSSLLTIKIVLILHNYLLIKVFHLISLLVDFDGEILQLKMFLQRPHLSIKGATNIKSHVSFPRVVSHHHQCQVIVGIYTNTERGWISIEQILTTFSCYHLINQHIINHRQCRELTMSTNIDTKSEYTIYFTWKPNKGENHEKCFSY